MANYQWYPGHMTKAKRMMQEDIKLIDLVIELVDARIPLSSRNPDIDELGKRIAELKERKEFTRYVGSASSNPTSITNKVKIAKQILLGILEA